MRQVIHLSSRAACTAGILLLSLAVRVASAQPNGPGADEPTTRRIVKLTNIETSYPHWSPDGRRIAYQSNRTGNSEIYVMNADGSGVVQLTHTAAVDENPAWSPGGQHIA